MLRNLFCALLKSNVSFSRLCAVSSISLDDCDDDGLMERQQQKKDRESFVISNIRNENILLMTFRKNRGMDDVDT